MKIYQHSKKYHNSTLHLVLLLLVLTCIIITKCNGGGVSMRMRKDASISDRSSSMSTNTDATSILTSSNRNSNVCSMDTNAPQFLYEKNHDTSNQRLNCCKNYRHQDENDFDGGLMEISNENTSKSSSKHTTEPNYILVDDTKRHLIRSASKWFTLGFSMFKVFTALYDDKNGDLDNNAVNDD